MRSGSVLVLFATLLSAAACRPSSDRVDAAESGAAASGGTAVSRHVGDPVAKGAEKATPETLPENLALAPAEGTVQQESENLPENSADKDPAKSSPGPALTIPAQYRGRWGLVPADCTSTRGDAKGLITIGQRTIRFYESTATLKEQNPAVATGFSGGFSFTGEGQTWEKDMDLSLQGNSLTRAEDGQRYTYTRCVG